MANASARTSVDEAAGSIASTLGRFRRESSCRRGCWVAAEPGSTCAGGPSSTPAGTYQTLRSGSRRAPKCLAMSFSAKGTCRSIRDAPMILFQAGALAGKSAETRGARSPEYFGRLRRDRQVCCGGGLRGEGSGAPVPIANAYPAAAGRPRCSVLASRCRPRARPARGTAGRHSSDGRHQ